MCSQKCKIFPSMSKSRQVYLCSTKSLQRYYTLHFIATTSSSTKKWFQWQVSLLTNFSISCLIFHLDCFISPRAPFLSCTIFLCNSPLHLSPPPCLPLSMGSMAPLHTRVSLCYWASWYVDDIPGHETSNTLLIRWKGYSVGFLFSYLHGNSRH